MNKQTRIAGLGTTALMAIVASGCGAFPGNGTGRYMGTETITTSGYAAQPSQVQLQLSPGANGAVTGQWVTPSGTGTLTGVMSGSSIVVTSLVFANAAVANQVAYPAGYPAGYPGYASPYATAYPSAYSTASANCPNYTGQLILTGNLVQGTLNAAPSAASPYVTCTGSRSMTNVVSY